MPNLVKKVKIFDKKIIKKFSNDISIISTVVSLILIFFDIPVEKKLICFIIFILFLLLLYLIIWFRNNFLQDIMLNINDSKLRIKKGNIFEEQGLKVVAFNEFFDTEVRNRLISENTLNGKYINENIQDVNELDLKISNDQYLCNNITETNVQRPLGGKTVRYKLGSIYKNDDYLLTAFSKFDKNNKAYLTRRDYIDFLLNFWEELDNVYDGEKINIPLLGSGITRFYDRRLSEQELLNMLIWSFKLSNIQFNSEISIIIYKDNIDSINLFDLKGENYGI